MKNKLTIFIVLMFWQFHLNSMTTQSNSISEPELDQADISTASFFSELEEEYLAELEKQQLEIDKYKKTISNLFENTSKKSKDWEQYEGVGFAWEMLQRTEAFDIPGKIGGEHFFKIHLQIKPKHITNFIKDFLEDLTNKKTALSEINISGLKFSKFHESEPQFNHYHIERAYPLIVLYVSKTLLRPHNSLKDIVNEKDVVYIDNSLRHLYLDSIIKPIIKWTNKWLKKNKLKSNDIVFGIQPRFNYKINEWLYMAGGNGDTKEKINQKYTYNNENKTFLKNFEYTKNHKYTLTKKQKSKLKKEAGYLLTFLRELKKGNLLEINKEIKFDPYFYDLLSNLVYLKDLKKNDLYFNFKYNRIKYKIESGFRVFLALYKCKKRNQLKSWINSVVKLKHK